MATAVLNWEFTRGDDWEETNGVKDTVTGQIVTDFFDGITDARMHVRDSRDGSILVSFEQNSNEIAFSNGFVTLTKARTGSATDVVGGNYVYDLEGTRDSKLFTLLRGTVTIVDDITHD